MATLSVDGVNTEGPTIDQFALERREEAHTWRRRAPRVHRTGDGVATSEKVLFSRFMSSREWRPVKLKPKRELEAVLAVSSPSDLGLAEEKTYQLADVDLDGEIPRAARDLQGIRRDVIGKDAPLTLDRLVEQLRDGVDIVYLACHGALSKDGKDPVLHFQNDDGTAPITPGAALAERIRELA